MSPVQNVLQVLSRPPGSLAYHVVLLFALEAMAGMAWQEWQRMRRQEYRQMTWGFLVLVIVRFVWAALEGLRWWGAFSPATLAWLWPPSHDALIVLSWALLLVSFLPLLLAQPLTKGLLRGIVAGIAVLLLWSVATALLWRATAAAGPAYERQWIAYLWAALQTALAAAGAYLALFRDPERRIWLGSGFLFLLLGQIGCLVQWSLSGPESAHGWTRLAELIAFPLLALVMHHGITSDLYAYSQELKAVSEESSRQTRELLFLLETSKATSSSLALDEVLESVVENVVLALNADQCAIAAPSTEDPEHWQVIATYDPLHADRLTLPGVGRVAATFDLCDHPVLKQVVEQKQPVIHPFAEDVSSAREIFQWMGSVETGPAIVQPLVSHGRVLGLLLVGNARSKRPFSQSDGDLCQALATQVATAMENARLYKEMEAQAQRLQHLLDLRQTERSLGHAILESMAEGVLVSDIQNKIILANAAAATILGQQPESLQGQNVYAFLTNLPESLRSGAKTLPQILAESGRSSLAIFSRLDGVETQFPKFISASLAPMLDEGGAFAGTVAVLREVSHEVASEQARNSFVAAVCRELRTPLTSMRGYLGLLLEEAVGPLNPTQRRFLEKAHHHAARVVEMANDLVDVAEIGPLGIELSRQPTDIAAVIASSLVSVQGLIEERKLTVDVDLQRGLPSLMADPARLEQVMVNLLDNACKYTPPGGRIEVRAALAGDGAPPYLAVSVKDTGVGISPEEQNRIFEEFYRAENPFMLEAGGAGLGLAVVKALVEAHGGRVWVESEPNAGSTFSFILPVVETAQEAS